MEGSLSDISGYEYYNIFFGWRQKNHCFGKKVYDKEDTKTTTITEYELLRHRTKIRKQTGTKFPSGVIVCSLDGDAAKQTARLFEELQDAGKMISENNLQIVGISM